MTITSNNDNNNIILIWEYILLCNQKNDKCGCCTFRVKGVRKLECKSGSRKLKCRRCGLECGGTMKQWKLWRVRG